jgi:hypothetical protein
LVVSFVALLAILLLAAAPEASPDDVLRAAALDLAQRVAPAKRTVTRYLSLHAVPVADREDLIGAITFTLNSTSFRSTFARPLLVADGLLVRIDLESLGWDVAARTARLARLEQAGVRFAFKDQAEKRRFLDVWEQVAEVDPYFRVTQLHGDKLVRGWLDPVAELSSRRMSQSAGFVVRGDWFLVHALLEKKDGGFYSDLLMFPPKEDDLYKLFGVDIKFVDRESQTKQGGAIVESDAVANNNRELQLIPSLFGYDDKFIWRTFDFASDDVGDKNVVETFGGTAKHDGREVIGSLPNGLHWYYLADGRGNQVNVVPQAIALDRRKASTHPINDRNVTNAYKCISCHGTIRGIWPFADVVRKGILDREVALAVIDKDPRRAADKKQQLEDYYLADLDRKVDRQQKSYAERVKDCTGRESGDNADNVIGAFDDYFSTLVTLEQAAREMGMPASEAKGVLAYSGNGTLALLSTGQPIRRAAWEKSFPDAMRARTYPWENLKPKGGY